MAFPLVSFEVSSSKDTGGESSREEGGGGDVVEDESEILRSDIVERGELGRPGEGKS